MTRSRLALFAWCALGVIWGSNFIFMKWAAGYITPLQIVFVRVLLGFVAVFLYAAAQRQLSLSHLRHAPHFAAMACLAAAIYYYGFARGTSLLPSGIAGAVSGAIPLFSLLAAALFLPEETLNRSKVVGLLVGFAGVLMIARPFNADPGTASIEGVTFMVIGSISLGVSFVYAKRFITPLRLSSAALTTYQLGLATLILAFITPFDGITLIANDALALTGLLLGLGLLGTGLAYIIYYFLVDEFGAVRASSVTYLPPIVALGIGAAIIGEPIGALDYLAAGLIFAGVALVNRAKA